MEFILLPFADPTYFLLFIFLPGLVLLQGLRQIFDSNNEKKNKEENGSEKIIVEFVESFLVGLGLLVVMILLMAVANLFSPQISSNSSIQPLVAGISSWLAASYVWIAGSIRKAVKNKQVKFCKRKISLEEILPPIALLIVIPGIIFVPPIVLSSPLIYSPSLPVSISTITSCVNEQATINVLISSKVDYPLWLRGSYQFNSNRSKSAWETIPGAPIIIGPKSSYQFTKIFMTSQQIQGYLIYISEYSYPILNPCN